ncbi:MAG TPA: LysR family transcriptional regulator [Ottowia sp.]|nr:LysR family transcriptional regulator [Pseudomonadota bacterium]HMN57429.1 LysR family transcriptional regulator [Ottowia sp.]
MYDWNDLKVLLAVARHGSTTAAGKALGVNQSTVQRRLLALERCFKRPLVQRHTTGYRLTALGEQLLPLAERVEQAAQALAHELGRQARELSGVVRVTCPEPIVHKLAASSLLERFHARYPNLKIEFVMSDRYLDLNQGEVDVALRSGDTEDAALVGRKIGDSLWAVYASAAYLARRGRPERMEDLGHHDWVGLDASLDQHRAALWLKQVAPAGRIVARNNSVLGLAYSAKAGLGLAPLPTPLGDGEPELVRVLGPIPELTRIWRVLTTPELRRTPRVAAFFDFMVEEIAALRPIITG